LETAAKHKTAPKRTKNLRSSSVRGGKEPEHEREHEGISFASGVELVLCRAKIAMQKRAVELPAGKKISKFRRAV